MNMNININEWLKEHDFETEEELEMKEFFETCKKEVESNLLPEFDRYYSGESRYDG